MTETLEHFTAGLPIADHAGWMRLVEKALKGADFERRLVSRTADGIAIKPLYTAGDAIADSAALAPGSAPFTRGALTARAGAAWEIRQLVAESDPATANAAILDELAGGVSALTLMIAAPGWFGLDYREDALAAALKGVLLDVCPIYLRAGEYTTDAAGSLQAIWRAAGIADKDRRGGFHYDPLGTLASTGALYHPLDRSMANAGALAAGSITMPGVTALLAHGHVFHAAGATPAEELGAVLSSVVAYLRACEGAGLPPDRALDKIAVALAVDADQFMSIAKLRAARRLIWRVADACGAGEAARRVRIAAETSGTMLTRRDPWVNLLRGSIACAAAAMGGADAISVLPFSWPLGRPDAFARRIARNIHIVAQEESGLGRVVDPAGGSWYAEKLTEDLAQKAWAVFQQIEHHGGLGAAIVSGWLQDCCAVSAAAHARTVATGKAEITGVSTFPRLGDDQVKVEPWRPEDALSADLNGVRARPLAGYRPSAPFEALRDAADVFGKRAGHPPRIFLASLGPLAEHAARSTWITNFLATGGIEAIRSDDLTSSQDAGAAFAASGADIACISASDATTSLLGEAAAMALRAAGARHIMLAGRPRDQEQALRAAGVGSFVFAGCDALAVLGELHGHLGVRVQRSRSF